MIGTNSLLLPSAPQDPDVPTKPRRDIPPNSTVHLHSRRSQSAMPPRQSKAKTAAAPAPSSPVKTLYLILYNFASAVAWSTVLGRVVGVLALHGPAFVYDATGTFTKWTQTMAIMEVFHSLLGMYAFYLVQSV